MTKQQKLDAVVSSMHNLNETFEGTGLISDEYANKIFRTLAPEVVADLEETSDYWSDDDYRLAVGRVLMKHLNIEP